MKGFCEKKFSSMFISGTFTKAVMYIMLLCDSIVAGYFIGQTGVAAINAITPVTGIVTFFGDLVSTGVGIVFTRENGAMIGFVSAHYGESALVTLAVVVSLIEFSVVLDGVGMAMQPLIGTYFGEKNHVLIKRVMRSGYKEAILEGVIATILIFIFAKQFCGLFGITEGDALEPSVAAIRIVCTGFTLCSVVSLTTSYFMLIDRIGMATCFAMLQNGALYIVLPILGSTLFGINGMWAGFVISLLVTLICTYGFVYLKFGKDNFPFLLKDIDSDIVVMDDTLTSEAAAALSERAGELFDITDPDMQVKGLSSFILSGLMEAHEEKAYLVTTGYNRNMIRFSKT